MGRVIRRNPLSMAPGLSRRGGLSVLEALLRRPEIFRLDAHSVVDCDGQLLLATEVTLCCLDRDVSKQELDLIQFAASEVTKPGAAATKVMRCKFVYARPRGGLPDNLPQHLQCHSGSPYASGLVDGSEQRNFSDAAGILPFIECRFYPDRDWYSPDVPGLAQQVGDYPVFLAQLDGINA